MFCNFCHDKWSKLWNDDHSHIKDVYLSVSLVTYHIISSAPSRTRGSVLAPGASRFRCFQTESRSVAWNILHSHKRHFWSKCIVEQPPSAVLVSYRGCSMRSFLLEINRADSFPLKISKQFKISYKPNHLLFPCVVKKADDIHLIQLHISERSCIFLPPWGHAL